MPENLTEPRAATLVRRKTKVNVLPFILIPPPVALLLIFFAPAIFYIFIQSFFKFSRVEGIVPDWNIGNYSKFLSDSFYLGVLWRTIRIAFTVMIITLILGYPVAYFIVFRGGRWRGLLILFVLSPLMVTAVIRAMGILMVLSPAGVVNDFLLAIRVRDEPVKLLFTETAVIFGLVQTDLPFMVVAIMASLQRMDVALLSAARNLGATAVQTFLRVTLPLSLPGILVGCILAFIRAAEAFATPAILGGGRVPVMATMVYQQALALLNWPFADAIAFILMAMVGLAITMGNRFVERGRYAEVFR